MILLVVLALLFGQSANWGDVATWVLAITTLLAFLAAAFAGLVAYDLLKVETARDEAATRDRVLAANERKLIESERAAQREAERRAQAAKVIAWFGLRPYGYTEVSPAEQGSWGALVRNASELPVFDIRIFFYWVNDRHDGSEWTTEQRYASVERFRVIPPEQTRYLELPDRVRSMANECNDDVYLVGVEFTDARGARWFRDERAVLHDRGGNPS
jgi:hypothetical protein